MWGSEEDSVGILEGNVLAVVWSVWSLGWNEGWKSGSVVIVRASDVE